MGRRSVLLSLTPTRQDFRIFRAYPVAITDRQPLTPGVQMTGPQTKAPSRDLARCGVGGLLTAANRPGGFGGASRVS